MHYVKFHFKIVLFIVLLVISSYSFADVGLGGGGKLNLNQQNDTKQLINSIYKDYENDLKIKKNYDGIKTLNSQLNDLDSGTISNDLGKQIINNTLTKSKKIDLLSGIKGKVSTKYEKKVYNNLLNSVVNNSKKSYKLYIESEYSKENVEIAISTFDKISIKFLYSSNGINYFELDIPYESVFGKTYGIYLQKGQIPDNLLYGVKIVKPFHVKLNDYTGEMLSSMRGITAIGADQYQQGLSTKNKIKVGVIDTGIDYNHNDLAGNMNVNSLEIPGNGKDDDNNGYVDDVYGYDFVGNKADPLDDHGHGTHVGGVIGGRINGGGIFGVNSNSSLVALRVLDSSGYGSSYGVISAINYAANNGIKVINMSLGGDGNPAYDSICAAISNAKAKGTISVVAAGNENASVSGKVPGGCTDTITVGAVDSNKIKASFSNYGTKVEIAAPGVSIYSTYTLNRYASMNGTSMATPFVAGLVSAVLAYNPNYNTDTMRTLLVNNSQQLNNNPNVGKFVDMNAIMGTIGVSPDGGNVNKTPTLSVSTSKVSKNYFKILSTATDSDGVISLYEYIVDGAVVQSGANLNTIYYTTLKPTSMMVRVTDNDGGVNEKVISLSYELNINPGLTISSTRVSKNYYKIISTATDSDGKVIDYKYYLDGEYLTGGSSLAITYVKIIKDSTLSVLVRDNLGGETQKSLALKVEPNSLPIITVTSTLLSKNNYMLNISASDSDGSIDYYEYLIDGTVVGSGTYLKSYLLNVNKDLVFTVKVFDNQGGEANKSLNFVFQNNIPPTLTVTAKRLNKNYYDIIATAKDSDGTIVNYEYYANDILVASGASLSKYRLTIFEPTAISVKVTDNLGGVTEKSVNLTFEQNKNPYLNTGMKKLRKNVYYFASSASDTDGYIAKYEYFANDSLLASGTRLTTYTHTITENTSFVVKVTDNLLGTTQKQFNMVFEENILPTITVTPKKVLKGNYLIQTTAKDVDGTIARYEYLVDNVSVASGASLTSYNLFFKNDVSVKVKVTDNLGGISEKSIDLIFEENILPDVILTGSRVVGNKFNMSVIATDVDGGIVKYEYFVDDQPVASGTTLTKYTINLVKDVVFKVKVTDKLGGVVEKTMDLDFDIEKNSLPVLNVVSKRTTYNKYAITVTSSDLDGTVDLVELYVDGVLYATGTKAYYPVLTKDMEILYKATDNVGGVVEKPISLKFEPNLMPTLTLSTKKNTNNYYTITSIAKDADGSIVNYSHYIDDELVLSGAKSNLYNLRVVKDINYKVVVTDNKGGTDEKSQSFVFNPNILPNLTISSKKLYKNNYTINASASDVDGTIQNYEYYLNDVLTNSGSKLTSINISINQASELKVKVTDNLLGVTEKMLNLLYEENILPTFTISSKKNYKNNFTVITTAKDSDGYIANYEYYLNDILLNSGSKLISLNFNVTKDSVLKVKVIDNLGGIEEKTIDYVFEYNNLPTINLYSKKLYKNVYSITFSGTDSDGIVSKYEYYVNGEVKFSGNKPVVQNLTIDKNTNVKLVVYDNVGGVSEKELELAFETNTLPNLTLKATKSLKNHYTIYSTATDTDGYIAKYEYIIDGNVVFSGAKASTYSIVIPNNQELTVRVNDNLGGVTEKVISLIYEENILPTVSLNAQVVTGNRYTLIPTASDPDGGIVKYEYIIQDKIVYNSSRISNYSLNILENTQVVFRVTDKLGGVVSKSVDLTYDLNKNALPVVNVIIKKVAANKYTYTLSATDLDGTVISYEIYADSNLVSNSKIYTAIISKDTIFTFKAKDNLGHYGEKSITVTYEKPNVAPLLTITKEVTSSGIPYIHINAKDSDGIINTVYIYINGKIFKSDSPKTSEYNYKISYKNPNQYLFKVVVVDNKSASSTQQLQIN